MRTYAKHTKYTREMLEDVVRESLSVAEVLRRLGKRHTGSIATHMSAVLKRLELDTSHFLGQRVNQGVRHRRINKIKWQNVLVNNRTGRKEDTRRLRRCLIESGRELECVGCQVRNKYNGKPITLEIHHIDGDPWNNVPDNLEFRCPNCHAQKEDEVRHLKKLAA